MDPEGIFKVAVGAIIEYTPTSEILLLKRSRSADFSGGTWEYVTGRMKQFEEPEAALKREAMEESGLDIHIVKPLRIFHFYRGEKSQQNETVGIAYWCTTESKDVTISDEHENYQWVTPQQASKTVTHPGILKDIQAFVSEHK